MDRDFDQRPYSEDEKRVAKYFFDLGLGGGDDPIGSLMAAHAYLSLECIELMAQIEGGK